MTSLVRWEPIRDLWSLQRDMDRLMAGIGMPLPTRHEAEATVMLPVWDVMTRGEDLVVRAELPGVEPADIEIAVTGDTLTVRGERVASTETTEQDYVLRESTFGSFERSMRLPEGAVLDRIKADYANGVLEILVPKAAPTEPATHKIEVHTPEKTTGKREHH